MLDKYFTKTVLAEQLTISKYNVFLNQEIADRGGMDLLTGKYYDDEGNVGGVEKECLETM